MGLVWMDGEPEAQRGAAFARGHSAERPRNCFQRKRVGSAPGPATSRCASQCEGPLPQGLRILVSHVGSAAPPHEGPVRTELGACAVFQWVPGTWQRLFC